MYLLPLQLLQRFKDETEKYKRERVTVGEAIRIIRTETLTIRLNEDLKNQIIQVRDVYGESMGSAYVRMALTEFPFLVDCVHRVSLGHKLDEKALARLSEILSFDLQNY